MGSLRNICVSLLLPALVAAAEAPSVVVVSAGGGDYVRAVGGTVAKLAADGFKVYVIQIANDEKNSVRLGPAETRLASDADAARAARALGVTELFSLNHKSGELAQVSSNELRNQLTVLIRTWKPQKLFFPDPYVHYTPEWDQFFTGRAAEETNYSNSGSFLYEFARAGLKGYSVPETYYYAVGRPYRPGEGGHNGARMEKFDIAPLMARKRAAVAALRTANRAYAEQTRARLAAAGKPLGPLAALTDTAAADLAIAWVDELSAAVGVRYGFAFAEEFNYHGAAPGEKRPLPAWIEERARPLP
ncbi:MAG: PIG-L family deacetylase [Acidobacteria bacterium]|nr:PIG-L family deacetylase [Acidobacteriota bacterium]